MFNSSIMREISAESDALHLGMGWDFEELNMPNIIIESTYGDSHPGSSHLLRISNHVRDGVLTAGGKPAIFVTTDICDGIAQGGIGIEYSLLSRDFIACMVEIHVRASLCDGLVLISSCDKSVPAHILIAARLDYPCIIVPGGCMSAGSYFLSVDQLWEIRRKYKKGTITEKHFKHCQANACPSEGACQPMGTAGTMQVLSEALGLSLPGTALIPASSSVIYRNSKKAGKQILNLVNKGITSKDILTKEAFENAITVHAAVGGSTNAVLHIIAAAKEIGVDIDLDVFEKIHKKTPYIVNTLNTGKYPTEYFWYAGGVPAVMNEIRELLDLNVINVTGKTLKDSLNEWLKGGFMKIQKGYLNNNNIAREDIIKSMDNCINKDGGIAVLKGNIAPKGAVVKHSAVSKDMHYFVGTARVFENEDEALEAFEKKQINEKDVVVILYQGPKACGMPEMFRTSDAILNYHISNIAILTDGRYSGCTSGPAIGYVSPEAISGGPIGVVKEGDIIEIDIENRTINLVKKIDNEEVEDGSSIIESRLKKWIPKKEVSDRGVRSFYKRLVRSSAEGAKME